MNNDAHKEERALGPIVGSVIILIVLIVGGVYFWQAQIEKSKANARLNEELRKEAEESAALESVAGVSAIRQQDKSDDVDSIEADLNNTSYGDLDF
jgi:uncharacterized protein HemX